MLLRRAVKESFAVSIRAGTVQPQNSSTQLSLILIIFAGQEVDEFRRARFNGAAGVTIRGDDGLAQGLQSLVFVSWEKLGCIDLGSRFFRSHHVMCVFGRLGRNNAQHRGRGRAHGQ